MKKIKIVFLFLILLFILSYFLTRNEVIKTYYYPSGELKSEFYNKSDRIQCGKQFYESGEIQYSYCRSLDSGIFGELREYYKSGKILSIVNFKNHKRIGVEKIYSENGSIIRTIPYINGKIQGWAFYYDLIGRKINEKYFYEDSMYYLKIYDKFDTTKYDDQIFPAFHFDKNNYWLNDTVRVCIVFKSDDLFPYKREEIIIEYDFAELDEEDLTIPYERFSSNLAEDSIFIEFIPKESGSFLFYTTLKHINPPKSFENKLMFSKKIHVQ